MLSNLSLLHKLFNYNKKIMRAFILCPGFLPINKTGAMTGKHLQTMSLLSSFLWICPYEADLNTMLKEPTSSNYVIKNIKLIINIKGRKRKAIQK